MKMLNNKGPKTEPCGTQNNFTPRTIFAVYFNFLLSISEVYIYLF